MSISDSPAFAPVRIGPWDLPQSFVMAPMTRSRAGEGNVPTSLTALYYAQRAGAGLVVTEGVAPSPTGQGYPYVPGLYTAAQVAGWREVAQSVHRAGGRIVAQLMHVGRIAHTSNKGGLESVAPSAVQAPGQMFTATGPQDHDVPRALDSAELGGVVEEFAQAARNAVAAGLDGVELHAANGYLLHQFLDPTVNRREDDHGGSPQARARFVIDVVTAVSAAIGAEKVGLRLSPGNQFNGTGEVPGADLDATYTALVDGIAPLGLAYLSLAADPTGPIVPLVTDLRRRFGGSVLFNPFTAAGTDLPAVEQVLATGLGDAAVVGRAWLANPDLVERWRTGAGLNEADPTTFYGGDATGYTDYPTLQATP